MMGKKYLMAILMVVMFAGLANAAITVTIVKPTENQAFFPNLDDTRFMDINFTVVDNNADIPIHTTTIQFAIGDTNRIISNDVNLSSSNCSFKTDQIWTTPGASCLIKYTFPTTIGGTIPTGSYVLDVNVVAKATGSGLEIAHNSGVTTFSIDNRFVNTAVEALLNILPIILIASMLVGIVLLGFGAIDGRTMLIIAVGAVVSIIAVMVLSGIMGVLTP